jgi:transglutaminase-like putative cysteine protease
MSAYLSRRQLLATSLGAATGVVLARFPWSGRRASLSHEELVPTPTFSITPIIGDGRWIWRDPPVGQSGYLEPRLFDLAINIRWEGTGTATDLAASCVAPVAHGEQEIVDAEVFGDGCSAEVQALGQTAAQLVAAAPLIERGQVLEATARWRLQLFKAYQGYERDRFPAEQALGQAQVDEWLTSSPGIECRGQGVRRLAESIAPAGGHPWDRALALFHWTWENIEGRPGAYTSVTEALDKRVGDCEERAGVFIALCRAIGIPSRLVWVPNHAWAEFALVDDAGTLHWIPAHTAAYSWFGWTGAHELVLQKGDRFVLPQNRKRVRLVGDWFTWQGRKPILTFGASLTPVGATPDEAGPGARTKQPGGQWKLAGTHPDEKYLRD